MTDWYVEVIVHAKVPAETAGEALGALCDYIRGGIGPEPETGEREWGTAISRAAIWDPTDPASANFVVNEEYQARHGGWRPARPS